MTSENAALRQQVADLSRQLAAARAEVQDLRRQLAAYQRGPAARRERARRRNEALLAFGVERRLAGGATWPAIHAAFLLAHPELVLTSDPPEPLDVVPLAWVRAHTIGIAGLAAGYRHFVAAAGRRAA